MYCLTILNCMDHKIILSEEEIQNICKDIGAKLTERLKDDKKPPLFLGVMKGALPFYCDLLKRVNLTMVTDFIRLSSYEGSSSTGKVNIKTNFTTDIKDRTVVIVEDVVDTGLSMKFLLDYLKANYSPKQIILVALFNKTCARKNEVHVDYFGKELEGNDFLMGYGLDYSEFDRNVPYVYAANPDDVKYWDSLPK